MSSSPRVNIVYVRGTVERLLPFLESLLEHTTWRFTAVSNGCSPEEVGHLQDARRRFPDRIEIRVVSTDIVLSHGEVIEQLLADEPSPYFCCVDSDIFAMRTIGLDELIPAAAEAATCSCRPLWNVERDEVLPEAFEVVSGRFLRTSTGDFLGCTYAFCYRTAELRSTVERWGIPLGRCDWEDLSADAQHELAGRGLRRKTYDTLTVANVLLSSPDRPMVYREIPGLLHLGAQSSLNQHVSTLRRPLRHIAWRWFPWAFRLLWRARGLSDEEAVSEADFARRRGEAVRLADALVAGRARYDDAPEWIGGAAEFDTLSALLGPRVDTGGRPIRVLHVTEAYGGGIVSSISELIDRTPDIEHHLLRTVRVVDHTDGEGVDGCTSVDELPRRPIAAMRAIRQAVARLRPDVVHAHSSYGGLYVRLVVNSRRTRVVYTPQGYGFLRTDISAAHRLLIREVERALTWNTTALAACSVHEAALATIGRPAMERHTVPNVVAIDEELVDRHRTTRRPDVLVACGRLKPIRDPEYFRRVVEAVRELHPAIEARWLGGKPGEIADQLRSSGIEVTGWLPRSELLAEMAEASVYVHTSRWDGFPLTVLEAVSIGVPSVARRIPQLKECPEEVLFDTPSELAAEIARLLASPMTAGEHDALWIDFLDHHSPELQRRRLLAAYGCAPDGCPTSGRQCRGSGAAH